MSDSPIAKAWFDKTGGLALKEVHSELDTVSQSPKAESSSQESLIGPKMKYDDVSGKFFPVTEELQHESGLDASDATSIEGDHFSPVLRSDESPLELMSAKEIVAHIEDCFDILVPKLKKAGARGAARKAADAREIISEVVRANE